MHVVICGGGVIGACTGYFLARRGIDVTVVERSEVASSASGKAGGFLALDWCAGSPLDALARRSFALHASLSEELDGDWGYQRMTAYSGLVVPERDKRRHVAAELDWLSDGVIIGARLSTTETTAIVHPRSFTLAMMRAAQQHGARLRHGQVTGVVRRGDAIVEGVEVDGETIRADAVVIAMGPWSLRAAEWLQLPAVFGQQSPSLVYDTGDRRACRSALSRLSGGQRKRRHSRSLPARRRQHPCHRLLRPGPAADGPCRRQTGPWCNQQTSDDLRAPVTGVPCRTGSSPGKPAFVR